ncbi:DUF222 domain-containing protein [Kribbella sp. CA-247076]|uniref:HNH endonuclease signature motif containing protein n=1 Tax=Kribbella sp. CA-247076 TaxID=3239941 RepID=UPI003D901C6E
MEDLGQRPVWSMSGSEMLSTLDLLDAELARLQTYRLQVIAGLEDVGYANEVGAHDTARLLTFRYRLNSTDAHRDVRLARALPKYATVSTALPDPNPTPPTTADPADSAVDPTADAAADSAADAADSTVAPAVDSAADPADLTADSADPAADPAAGPAADSAADRPWLLRPAQAEAIVTSLERVPATVPVEDLEVAEQQLVSLARHLSPAELRRAGKQIRDLLDTDGPEPDEHKAYARESLTLSDADNGVTFRGYLANENAELLRALIHANARPHKTVDGDPDPRPRAKRQADALTTTLTLAATTTDTTPRRDHRHSDPPRPAPADTADRGDDRPSQPPRATPTDTDLRGEELPGDPPLPAATSSGLRGDDRPTTDRRSAGVGTALAGDGTTSTDRDRPAAEPTGSPAADHLTGAGGGRSGGDHWVPGFGAKANITVTIDLNDLKAATADATGQLVYGDDLSAAAIRRLACDANIIPLVLGTNSEPLDIGRAARLVNRHLRRALNARDKGCVVCAAPPIHCDAHHLHSWLDGGPTAINNLVLLCRRHHRDLHSGHWTIHITNGTVHVTRPTWADPPPPTLHRTTNPPPPRPSRSHPPLPNDASKDHQAPPSSAPPASAPAASAPAASAPAAAGPNSTACAPAARTASGMDSAWSVPAPSGSEGPGPSPLASAHSACAPPVSADSGPAVPTSADSAPAVPTSADSAPAVPTSAAAPSAASTSAPPDAARSAWAASPPEPDHSPNASGTSTPPPRRPSRWIADDEKLRQAAHFAVWDNEPSDDRPPGNPIRGAATPTTDLHLNQPTSSVLTQKLGGVSERPGTPDHLDLAPNV